MNKKIGKSKDGDYFIVSVAMPETLDDGKEKYWKRWSDEEFVLKVDLDVCGWTVDAEGHTQVHYAFPIKKREGEWGYTLDENGLSPSIPINFPKDKNVESLPSKICKDYWHFYTIDVKVPLA